MSAELLPIESVISNPDNPRVLKDDRYAKLKKSIEDFPEMLWKRPLVVVKAGRKKHMVLGGNARLKACVELGIAQVPVIHADDWSEEQRKQFVIKDNVSTGDWDWAILSSVWDEGLLDNWGVPFFKTDDVDMDNLFMEGDSPGRESMNITLKYTADDHQKVIAKFNEIGGSKEQVVFNLLGLT